MKKCEYTLEKKIEMNDKLYIVIPAYNEEENIEKVVKDWYPIVEKYGEDSKRRLFYDHPMCVLHDEYIRNREED